LAANDGDSDIEQASSQSGPSRALSSRPVLAEGVSGLLSDASSPPIQPVTRAEPEQPSSERRGTARRELNTTEVDAWNRILPTLTRNPALHRAMFESWMLESTCDEPEAAPIKVYNDVDSEGAPPDMEFVYSNRMLYHKDVPDPELGLGCDCDGPCDPKSTTCSCLKRQELYSYNLVEGFAYDECVC
jgi:histone-lysine N-methyltransferase SUV39H